MRKQIVTITYEKPVIETATYTYVGLSREWAEQKAVDEFLSEFDCEIMNIETEEISYGI